MYSKDSTISRELAKPDVVDDLIDLKLSHTNFRQVVVNAPSLDGLLANCTFYSQNEQQIHIIKLLLWIGRLFGPVIYPLLVGLVLSPTKEQNVSEQTKEFMRKEFEEPITLIKPYYKQLLSIALVCKDSSKLLSNTPELNHKILGYVLEEKPSGIDVGRVTSIIDNIRRDGLTYKQAKQYANMLQEPLCNKR